MPALTIRRLPLAFAAGVTVLTLTALALIFHQSLAPETILYFWVAIGGAVGFIYYALKGELLSTVLLWFITLIALHEEFWRVKVPFFFALTIPRLGIVVLLLLWVAMLLLGRFRFRAAWPISGVIFLLAAYFCVSAGVSGFETRSIVTVHYRLIGGYLFPFATFALILHAISRERNLLQLTIFFAILSVYLTFVGWCEQFNWRGLIFPSFINDPSVGIHWGRVRGPFVMSPGMGLTLTFCFFSNLVLARNIYVGRWLLYLMNLLMLPAIFWTKTRSVWLGFLMGCAIWVAYSQRRTARAIGICLLLGLGLTVAVVNMGNFLSENRDIGGWMDMEPMLMRLGLAKMTWGIFEDHPFFGVGFGHFRDFAPAYAQDPVSAAYAYGSSALEHNNLLSILAETGVIGVVLYILLMVMLIRCSIRLYHKLPVSGAGFFSRDLLVLYWVLAAAYLIDGTFRETSDNPFVNSLFFGISAIPPAMTYLLSPVALRARPGFPLYGREIPPSATSPDVPGYLKDSFRPSARPSTGGAP